MVAAFPDVSTAMRCFCRVKITPRSACRKTARKGLKNDNNPESSSSFLHIFFFTSFSKVTGQGSRVSTLCLFFF